MTRDERAGLSRHRNILVFAFLAVVGLAVLLGQISATAVRRHQVDAGLRHVLSSAYAQEHSIQFFSDYSYLRTLYSALHSSFSDGNPSEAIDAVLIFCRKGRVVGALPQWVSVSRLNCGPPKKVLMGKIHMVKNVPFNSDLKVHFKVFLKWYDPIALMVTFFILLIGAVMVSWSYLGYRERIQIGEVFTGLEKVLANPVHRETQIKGWSINSARLFEKRVVELKAKFEQAREVQVETRANAMVGEIAGHVAHDIRSPLSILFYTCEESKELPPRQRVLMRSAVNQIQGIANDLFSASLAKKRMLKGGDGLLIEGPEIDLDAVLIFPVIDEIIAEKRLQYRSKIGIRFFEELEEGVYGLFAKVNLISLKRILSNLVNNSVEAFTGRGNVRIRLYDGGRDVCISVKDDGPGIDPKVIRELGQPGVSYGKEEGLGLGLFYAKQTIEKWMGRLEIDSTPELGTEVIIRVPKTRPPEWFIPQVDVSDESNMILISDDPNLEELFAGRVKEDRIKFIKPFEFGQWYERERENLFDDVFIVDQEPSNSSQDGISLLEKYEITNRRILITERLDDQKLLDKTSELGIKILPKSAASEVPIFWN